MTRTLEFWPQQQHHLLVAGGRTIVAGGTFEASEEDAIELLANPEIREPEGAASAAPPATQEEPVADGRTDGEGRQRDTWRQQGQRSQQPPQPQSPGRAERSSTT